MAEAAPRVGMAVGAPGSKFSNFLGRSPHTATVEDLRRFQLHLVDSGTGPVTTPAADGQFNITATSFMLAQPGSDEGRARRIETMHRVEKGQLGCPGGLTCSPADRFYSLVAA